MLSYTSVFFSDQKILFWRFKQYIDLFDISDYPAFLINYAGGEQPAPAGLELSNNTQFSQLTIVNFDYVFVQPVPGDQVIGQILKVIGINHSFLFDSFISYWSFGC